MRVWFLAACLVLAAHAEATTFYVSKSGNDSNSCTTAQSTTLANEKLSITAGIACLASGDTLLVRTGTYNEVFMNPSISSGSAGAYTRIAAFPGTSSPSERDPSLAGPPAGWDAVWVTPSSGTGAASYVWYFQANQQYLEIDGINTNGLDAEYGVFKVDSAGAGFNPHHIRYKNAEIQYGSNNPAGVSNAFLYSALENTQSFIGGNESINLNIHADVGGVQSGNVIGYTHYIVSSDNVVAGCNLHHSGSSAVQVNNDHGSRAQRNIIRNNWIHDILLAYNNSGFFAYWGIITDVDDDTTIYNNVLWNIGLAGGNQLIGMNIFSSVRTLVYNNTLYGINSGNDIGIYVGTSSSGTVTRNNIAYNFNTDYSPSSGSATEDHNLFANPGFVNAAGHDFRLASTGSGAYNTGLFIALVATDVLGLARPQGGTYDMGAYEFGAASDPYITPAAGAVVASAAFTGTSGTNLTAYTADIGGNFFQHPSAPAVMAISTANRARLTDTNVAFYYTAAAASTNEYDVSATVRVVSLAGNDYKLFGRFVTTAYTGIHVYYNIADSTFYLSEYVDGVGETVLVSAAMTLTPSTSYAWRLKLRAGSISFDVDGTQILYTTTVPITVIGKSGIGGYSATTPSDAVGLHFDDFTITDLFSVAPTLTRMRLRWK